MNENELEGGKEDRNERVRRREKEGEKKGKVRR